ncbi:MULTISPECIES: CATRA system-associated protein [Streptomyces]|uniref:ATP-dependent Clp protease proteolytic subunit n=2 Tax=Streptomyces sudanensis TaxID=436397 RepID=A0ABY4TCI1_9ACTN|nr:MULTISPECIES: CATRA system-associated protein [Streptomyces]URN14710.1 ATP-dependent Clp protease proteolytic subunit [Streptomyces sudanensis]
MVDRRLIGGTMERDDLLRHRIVRVDREIDDDLANGVTTQLLRLAGEGPADITLYVDSGGGSVPAGMAIRDTMRYVPCDVSTVVGGLAAGMGQYLLSAGARGKRYAVPWARILLAEPWGRPQAGSEEAMERMLGKIAGEIAEDTGQTVGRIREDWGPDAWFTAEEARAYGLVDHVAALVGPRAGETVSLIRSCLSPEGGTNAPPGSCGVEPETRRMAMDVLEDIPAWRLRRGDWNAVGHGLEAMRRSLAAGDTAGLRRALADVEMAGPHRIVGLEDAALLPLPEECRERVDELVHALEPAAPADRAGGRTTSGGDGASSGAAG